MVGWAKLLCGPNEELTNVLLIGSVGYGYDWLVPPLLIGLPGCLCRSRLFVCGTSVGVVQAEIGD